MPDLVARAVFQGDFSGLVKEAGGGEAALVKLRAAAAGAANEGKNVTSAYSSAIVALEGQTAAAEAAAKAVAGSTESNLAEVAALEALVAGSANVTASISARLSAQQLYVASVNEARTALAQGLISEEQYGKAVDAASASLALAIAAEDDHVKALVAEREAAVATAAALRELGIAEEAAAAAAIGSGLKSIGQEQQAVAAIGAGLKSFGGFQTELAAARSIGDALKALGPTADHVGQSARALEGELTHLSGAAGVGRGDMLALRAAFDLVAENPLVAALVAMAAALGALAYEGNVVENANIGISNAVALTANAVGLTRDQVQGLTADVAKAADVSETSAEAMVASFIKNKIDPSLWVQTAAAARGYAVVIGKDIPDAAADLSEKLAKGEAGVRDLEQILGNLPPATEKAVEDLINSGHAADAMRLALTQLKPELDGQKLSTFAAGWENIETHISNAAAALTRYLSASHLGRSGWNVFDPMAEFEGASAPSPLDAGDGVTDDPSPLDAGAGVTDDPLLAHMQTRQATINSFMGDAATLSKALDPFPAQLEELSKEQEKYTDALKTTGLTAEQTAALETTLHDIHTKTSQVLKAQRDAQLNLNDAEKAHEELIKRLVLTEGPQAVKQAQEQEAAYEHEATAAFGSSYALKDVQEQFDIQKATLPYVSALTYAHGDAATKLTAIIKALTAALMGQQTAQRQLAAVQDVHQQFAGLQDLQTYNPMTDQVRSAAEIQKLSASIAASQVSDNQAWLEETSKQLDDWYAKNKDTVANATELYQQYTSDMQTIFGVKQAKVYSDDLARRTDWASGAERGYENLEKSTQNWAKTSETLTADASQKTEDDIVGGLTNSEDALKDYEMFWINTLAKLLYQKYLANSVNSLLSAGIDAIGDFLGLPSGGGDTSTVDTGKVGAEQHHTGGTAGDAAVMRFVSPDVFAGAPRLHRGSLAPDEVPAILKKKEIVLTEAQGHAIGNALSAPIEVQVPAAQAPQFNNNFKVASGISVQQGPKNKNSSGGLDQDFIIDFVDRGLADRNTQGRSQLSASLENTHDIRRSPS